MRTIVLTFILLLSTVMHDTDSCSSWHRRERPKPQFIEQPIITETTTEQLIEVSALKTIAPECPVCTCNHDSTTAATTITTTTITVPPPPPSSPVVTREMNSDSDLFKINGVPCPKEEKYKYFCGGRGRCFMIMFSAIDYVIGCECHYPYAGLRCEEKQIDGYYGNGLKINNGQNGFKSPNETEEGFKVQRKFGDEDEEEGFVFKNKADGKVVNGFVDENELDNEKEGFKVQNKYDIQEEEGFKVQKKLDAEMEENSILQNGINQKEDLNVQNERDIDGRNRRHAGIKKMRRGKKHRFHSTNE